MNPREVFEMLMSARQVTLGAGPLTFDVEIVEVHNRGSSASLHVGFEILVRTIGAPKEEAQPLKAPLLYAGWGF